MSGVVEEQAAAGDTKPHSPCAKPYLFACLHIPSKPLLLQGDERGTGAAGGGGRRQAAQPLS